MLHAERLTRLMADEQIVEILLDQAKANPERRELLERYLDRAELRARALHERDHDDGRPHPRGALARQGARRPRPRSERYVLATLSSRSPGAGAARARRGRSSRRSRAFSRAVAARRRSRAVDRGVAPSAARVARPRLRSARRAAIRAGTGASSRRTSSPVELPAPRARRRGPAVSDDAHRERGVPHRDPRAAPGERAAAREGAARVDRRRRAGALIVQRIVTGTRKRPEAIVAELCAIVPLGKAGAEGEGAATARAPCLSTRRRSRSCA